MTLKRLSSREVYRNQWMTVREDAIRRADGSDGIYGVVSKPDFAVIIPFTGFSFHLVEQFRYPVGGRYLEFPQGSWETAPTAAPEDVARGELAEETGLGAGRMTHLGRLFVAYGYSDQGMHVFLAEDLRPGEQNLSPEEAGLTCVEVGLDRFESMVRRGEIKDAATLAAYTLFKLAAMRTV